MGRYIISETKGFRIFIFLHRLGMESKIFQYVYTRFDGEVRKTTYTETEFHKLDYKKKEAT